MAAGLAREIAWNGIAIRVPRDWNLAAVSDEPGSGYVRVDDEDMPRVEVKWELPKGAPDLEKVKRRLLEQVRRGSKKARAQLMVVEPEEGQSGQGNPDLVTFEWRADVASRVQIQRCKKCKRVTVAQVYMPLEEVRSTLPERVLATLRDHPDDAWVPWSVYEFRFDSPPEFTLAESHMYIGRLELNFARGEETLQFAQWGAADQRLGGEDLSTWVQREFRRELKNHRAEISEQARGEDPGVCVEGRDMAIRTRARAVAAALLKRETARVLRWHMWHCRGANRLYAVRGLLAPSGLGLFAECVERVVCH